MEKSRPWHLSRVYGGGLREGMYLLLLPTMLVLAAPPTESPVSSIPVKQTVWRRGMISLECPIESCLTNNCEIYTLSLSKPLLGRWSKIPPQAIRTECNFNDTCSARLSAEHDRSWEYPLWCSKPTNCETNPDYPTQFDWSYACLISQILEELPNHEPPHEDRNIALSRMSEFAHERNVSNCWICQHLPLSSKAPMLAPVSFTEADWSIMGLSTISNQIATSNEGCYTPPSHAESSTQTTPNYVGDKGEVVQFAVRTFNYENRPGNASWAALFRLTYYKQYVQQGLRYQMQMTLAETNCKTEEEWLKSTCSLIPNTASLRYEVGIQSVPWTKTFKVTHSSWTKHDCTKSLVPIRPKNRDCLQPIAPIPVHPLTNVSHCIQFFCR